MANVKTVQIELPARMTVTLGYEIGGHEFDIAKLSADTIRNVVDYGLRQVCNDGGANPAEGQSKADAVLARAVTVQANEHSFGGGGSRLSPVDRVLRDWLVEDLTDSETMGVAKMKKAKADKLVKDSVESAFAAIHAARGDESPVEEAWAAYLADVEKEVGRLANIRASRRR